MKNPTMLYKSPGPHEIHGGKFDYTIFDEDEVEQAIADGWSLTTTEAKEVAAKKAEFMSAVTAGQPADSAPPTRAELEAKAVELGLKFDGRYSDKTLGEMIEAKLKEQA